MVKLICIHGNSLDRSIFDSISVEGFEKVTLDLPGHGSSPLGDASSFQHLVNKVYDQIHQMPEIILLGCSLGGHIAHHLLERLTPLALITISAPPLNLETVGAAFNKDSLGNLLFQAHVSEAQADMLADSMLSLRKDQKSTLRSLILATDPEARKVIAQSLMKCEFLDEVKLLERFQGEKILIFPTLDTVVNRENFQATKVARVCEIPGNHILPVDNPTGLNEFLSRELAKFRK